jgi:hypothetical protein
MIARDAIEATFIKDFVSRAIRMNGCFKLAGRNQLHEAAQRIVIGLGMAAVASARSSANRRDDPWFQSGLLARADPPRAGSPPHPEVRRSTRGGTSSTFDARR